MAFRAPLPPPDFRPHAALPELAFVERAVQAGDWMAIRTFFDQCADEQIRCAASRTAAETSGAGQLLTLALQQYPGDLLAATMLADWHIRTGWAVRTTAPAKEVSPAQWALFRQHLDLAEQLLTRVIAHEPGLALAWTLRLTTARGLGLGMSEARRRYRRLAEIDPQHYIGQSNLLRQLLPKWGGSWEAAHTFARETLRDAPDGSMAGVLIAEYHLERWTARNHPRNHSHPRRAEVRRELAEAAARSVLHPACRARYGVIGAHSTFAMLAVLAGDHRAAAVHFRAMGPFGSTHPWEYLGRFPETYFIDNRKRALAKG